MNYLARSKAKKMYTAEAVCLVAEDSVSRMHC